MESDPGTCFRWKWAWVFLSCVTAPAEHLWMTHRQRPGAPAGTDSWWGSLIVNKRDLTGQLSDAARSDFLVTQREAVPDFTVGLPDALLWRRRPGDDHGRGSVARGQGPAAGSSMRRGPPARRTGAICATRLPMIRPAIRLPLPSSSSGMHRIGSLGSSGR